MLLYHIRATKEIEVFQVLFWILNLRVEAILLPNEGNLKNLRECIFLLQKHGKAFMSNEVLSRIFQSIFNMS